MTHISMHNSVILLLQTCWLYPAALQLWRQNIALTIVYNCYLDEYYVCNSNSWKSPKWFFL